MLEHANTEAVWAKHKPRFRRLQLFANLEPKLLENWEITFPLNPYRVADIRNLAVALLRRRLAILFRNHRAIIGHSQCIGDQKAIATDFFNVGFRQVGTVSLLENLIEQGGINVLLKYKGVDDSLVRGPLAQFPGRNLDFRMDLSRHLDLTRRRRDQKPVPELRDSIQGIIVFMSAY